MLARRLGELVPAPREEQVRHYAAARALRPTSAHELADLLEELGRGDESLAVFADLVARRPADGHHLACYGHGLLYRHRPDATAVLDRAVASLREATRLRPDDSVTRTNLAKALHDRGKPDEAIAELREAIRLKPDDYLPHNNLGRALHERGKLDEAVAEFRTAVGLKGEFILPHYNLGRALYAQGELDEAVAEFREAIRLKPDSAEAYYNLGRSLHDQGKLDEAVAACREAARLKPGDGVVHNNLGNALRSIGKIAEAAAEFRESIRLEPHDPAAHYNLGNALIDQGKPDEAVAELREAIRLRPDYADYHISLGKALRARGDLDGALVELREAVRLRPDHAEAHSYLGIVLKDMSELDEALVEFREAIRLRPDFAEAHCNLGIVLRQQGEYAGAVSALRRGHELGSKRPGWRHPSARWLAVAERLDGLAGRLDAVLKGDDRPRDDAERLAYGQMCFDTKRYAAAARLWGEALEDDPRLGEDRRAQHRYNAACAAALAADGKDRDGPLPMEGSKALRARALGWLRAELDAWAKVAESDRPQAKATVVGILQHWQKDTDLAPVRDPAALAKLPEAERREWEALWADVDALRLRVQ
jgi:Flp pilus assembly protein TadD